MKRNKTALSLAVGSAFAASMLSLPAAQADNNPFAMQQLQSGYLLADNHAKPKEGKCGEGKCGGKKDAKAKDGKCGEGKCGGAKAKDGKCGEGKCGGAKKSDKAATPATPATPAAPAGK